MGERRQPLKMQRNKMAFAEPKESLSLISRVTRILIATNLIPVKVDYELNAASFKLFSLKTLKYLVVAYFPFIIFPGLTFILQPDYALEYSKTFSKIYSAFDTIWVLAFNIGSNAVAPLIMLVLAQAFPHLSEISLSRNIPFLNKSILLHVGVCTIIVISGYCLMNLGHYLAVEPHLRHFQPHQNHILVAGYLAISVYSCGFSYSVPMILAVAWVAQIKNKIDGDCQSTRLCHLINN